MDNIVFYWLRHLQLDYYFPQFLEHGYDELETIKCMGEEDLIAVGVNTKHHRYTLIQAVTTLRQKGAAWVYFLPHHQEESTSHESGSNSSGLESCHHGQDRVIMAEMAPTHRNNDYEGIGKRRGNTVADQNQKYFQTDLIETCVTSHYEKLQSDESLFGFIKSVPNVWNRGRGA